MKTLILLILLSFAPHTTDAEEPRVEREARLELVASAIASVAKNRREAVMLVTVGWFESRFASYVGEGRCLDGPSDSRCDVDPETGKPRARGYWQLWQIACPSMWRSEPGSRESVMLGARCAARQLRSAERRCRTRAQTRMSGAFSGYRGASCTWKGAPRRAAFANRLLRRF